MQDYRASAEPGTREGVGMSMGRSHSRRSFLRASGGFLAAAPLARRRPGPSRPRREFDPDFASATEAAEALRTGAISSRELTAHVLERIARHNPALNAFITVAEEQAMAAATEADEARARGREPGRLEGVPIVVKDQFSTAGLRTTYGFKRLEGRVPASDAVAVARLRRAGAVIVGKTSLPEAAADHQTYNDLIGTTNNPWDLARTPGGSTGGGAAALAAGLGFLEIGSDLGGSIRNPAHFCGVYGHKSTLDLVPSEAPLPAAPGTVHAPSELGVAGPLARSAEDLGLELATVGGPGGLQAVAYRWSPPFPRLRRLREGRLGFVYDDPFCPLTAEVASIHARAIDALRRAGASLDEGWPPGFDPQAAFESYFYLASLRLAPSVTEDQLESFRRQAAHPAGDYARRRLEALTSSAREWTRHNAARYAARAVWSEYFRTHDAFLMPVSFLPAFPHDHSQPMYVRQLDTPEGRRLYLDLMKWVSPATLSGCPATSAPIGITRGGLPVGIQIMGPYLEDATPMVLAQLMADVVGGFQPPPRFAA